MVKGDWGRRGEGGREKLTAAGAGGEEEAIGG